MVESIVVEAGNRVEKHLLITSIDAWSVELEVRADQQLSVTLHRFSSPT